MLIGEITKDTEIIVCYGPEENCIEYTTYAISCGDNNFELRVALINDENGQYVKFDNTLPIKIKLSGSSNFELKVDAINFSYCQGKATHVICSRSHIAVNNKRDTFRLPFKIDCKISSVVFKNIPGRTNDISYEGISVILPAENCKRLTEGSVIDVQFEYGLTATEFKLHCKIVRLQPLNDKCLLGCTVEQGGNQLRTLITHLQREELRKRRGVYTLNKQ